jgi:SAM-dependent methyltransferase
MSMTSGSDNSRIASHFSSLLAEHGMSARALDWGNRQSQEARFAVLADMADLSGASILDVGCGLADFHAWLLERGVPHAYTGIDITPEMVTAASARFPEITMHHGEILNSSLFPERSFDYVFASGVFYLRQEAPEAYMQATVTRLFSLCRKAAAFNSLSVWSPVRDPGEFYANPLATAAWCAELTPRLVLRHDYHTGDFTIYLYRRDAA